MSKPGAFGTCGACGARKGKAAMVAHLKECLQTRPVANGGAVSEMLLLRAQARGTPIFWLDAAMKREAKLKDLDSLLRRVWLECCGHLSEFFGDSHRKTGMNTRVSDVLGVVGDRLGYVYDFGSSTELIVSLLGPVDASSKGAVRLAARNEPPTWPCDACGKAATEVCTQCLNEGEGFCCAAHASTHECGEEMMLPVVNSPRMGVCGYTGEASSP